jgi:alcohol dehydrogenase
VAAVVLRDRGRGPEKVKVTLRAPGQHEVLVRVEACGVCHADLSAARGTLPIPMPVILGHEAAGVVEEIGPGVRGLAPGDRVVLTVVNHCGACGPCARGEPSLCLPGLRRTAPAR